MQDKEIDSSFIVLITSTVRRFLIGKKNRRTLNRIVGVKVQHCSRHDRRSDSNNGTGKKRREIEEIRKNGAGEVSYRLMA